MTKGLRLLTISLTATIAAGMLTAAAHAAPAGGDYFSTLTKPPQIFVEKEREAQQSPSASMKPVEWFERFDCMIASHKISAGDRVILSRPINQNAERLEQWCETAEKVSRGYKALAKDIKSMPVPNTLQGVKDYRDLTADWYKDAADIFADLTRPKRPARTMEELEGQLEQIKRRSDSLKNTQGNLRSMDLSLRKTYKVHLARHEDALQQYVRSPLTSQQD